MSTKLELIRDVTREECPWLERDFGEGEVVYSYEGYDYGVINKATGRPIQLEKGTGTFYEMPKDALRPI